VTPHSARVIDLLGRLHKKPASMSVDLRGGDQKKRSRHQLVFCSRENGLRGCSSCTSLSHKKKAENPKGRKVQRHQREEEVSSTSGRQISIWGKGGNRPAQVEGAKHDRDRGRKEAPVRYFS